MLKLLAVAALDSNQGIHTRTSRAGGTKQAMRTRLDFDPGQLLQEWGERQDDNNGGWWRMVEHQGYQFALMVKSAPGFEIVSAEALEEYFLEAFSESCGDKLTSPPIWLARFLSVPGGASPPTGWLAPGAASTHVGTDSDQKITVTCSWGNGLIEGPLSLESELGTQVIMGLIDAQMLWRNLTDLSMQATECSVSMVNAESIDRTRDRTTVSRTTSALRRISARSVAHHLLYDEVLTHIQGPRRWTLDVSLRSWGYAEMAARVESRIKELNTLSGAVSSSMDSRYQRAVERGLGILGFFTIVDTILNLISTAYSGYNQVPADGSRLLIFSSIRAINADILLAIAFLAIMASFFWLYARSK